MSDISLPDLEDSQKLRVLNAQLMTAHARVLEWHAKITSGAYLFKTAQKMVNGQWEPLSDAEKLEDAAKTMGRHVKWMDELTEAIATINGGDLESIDELGDIARYQLRFKHVGSHKIKVIKAIRMNLGLPLKESKQIVDAGLDIADNLSNKDAKVFKRELEAAGAHVEMVKM